MAKIIYATRSITAGTNEDNIIINTPFLHKDFDVVIGIKKPGGATPSLAFLMPKTGMATRIEKLEDCETCSVDLGVIKLKDELNASKTQRIIYSD